MAATAIITAAAALYGGISAQDQARRANNIAAANKKATKDREDQLAAEAAAKALAAKKAETSGQRAGFGTGAGVGGTSAFSRASFIGSSASNTGFGGAVKEDNLGRGSLFGN